MIAAESLTPSGNAITGTREEQHAVVVVDQVCYSSLHSDTS